MKNGTYKISFEVELTDCQDEDAGNEAVMAMLNELLDNDQMPEVNFELLEELDPEYNAEEFETKELSF